MAVKIDRDEVLNDAIERFRYSQDYFRDIYEKGRIDLEFVAGKQWEDDVLEERRLNKRPTLTINKLRARVRTVLGDLKQTSPSIVVKPVDEKTDPKIAEIYESLIRAIERQSKAKDVYLRACEQAISCGVGHFRIVNQYTTADSFDQDLIIKSIPNPFSVYWDTLSYESDFSDARYCFVVTTVSRKDFERKYKDKLGSFNWIDLVDDEWVWDDRIRIAEYWWKEPYKKRLALVRNPNTYEVETVELTKELTEDVLVSNGYEILRQKTVEDYKVMYCKLTSFTYLEKPKEWVGKYIPIVTVLGDEIIIGEKREIRSIIRDSIDSQKLYNYWKSTIAEYITLMPKIPYLVTPKMIDGFQKYWQTAHLKTYPYLPYNPDPKAGEPKRLPLPQVPREMFTELVASNEDIKETTGIYDAYIGAKSNETSGKAIQLRMSQTSMSIAPFFDNLRKAVEHAGRIIVDLIPKIYDTERYIRIVNPDESEELIKINQLVIDPETGEQMIMNDLTVGKYDVVVEAGTSYATKREQSLQQIIELIRVYPDIVPFVADMLIEAMDLPKKDVIIERLRKSLPMLAEQSNQGEQADIGTLLNNLQQGGMQ